VRISEHGQDLPDKGKRHRIVVQVKADIGRLADRHRDMLEHRRRVGWQCQQPRSFFIEHRADGPLGLIWTAPIAGWACAPGLGLGVEVVDIGEAACGEERVPDKPYGSFHAAFFVAACDRYGTRLVTIIAGKPQQGGMEADRIAASFQHGALEIIVEQDTRHATPGRERRDMTAQEVFHASIKEEAQEYLARVAQHHDERH
jgi:hypothetical protein